MDLIEALARDDSLFTRPDGSRWEGFGLAIQAYQKRGVPMVDWTARLARKYDRKFFVRLVKGAYWDTEIKLSHVGGFRDFPVFTRKLATDVSYLACAEKMLAADDAIYLYTGYQLNQKSNSTTFSPSFAVGLYDEGDGKDLGHAIEFKTQIQVLFEISSSSEIGISYNHISNASLGDKNPGANSYMFNFTKKF